MLLPIAPAVVVAPSSLQNVLTVSLIIIFPIGTMKFGCDLFPADPAWRLQPNQGAARPGCRPARTDLHYIGPLMRRKAVEEIGYGRGKKRLGLSD